MIAGGWKFAGVSHIGTSHLAQENPVCQDAHRCLYLAEADAVLCVVSDGAGSALRAEQGSRLACEMVVESARAADPDALFTEDFAKETLARVRAAIAETAASAGLRPRDYACTLLVVLAAGDRAAFWQLGDGAICLRTPASPSFVTPFWPAKGEYANMTHFVTDSNAAEEMEIEVEAIEIADLALFSDGLERLALDFALRQPHQQFLAPLFPFLHVLPDGHQIELEDQMTAFLASPRINAQTEDDKTLILASRVSRPIPPAEAEPA